MSGPTRSVTLLAMPHLDPIDALTFAPVIVAGRDSGWLYVSDGRVIPRVRGAAGDEGGGDSSGAEGDGGSGETSGGGAAGEAASSSGDAKGDKAPEPKTVTMTQAELDDMIAKRVAKATKSAKDEADQAATRAKMDEVERLKAEKADSDKAAAETTSKANAKLVRADAKVAAMAAGVKADRVDAFLRVANLGDVKVSDDGDPDAKAIAKTVADTLKEFPEFKAAAAGGAGASGGEHNGTAGTKRAGTLEDAVNSRLAG